MKTARNLACALILICALAGILFAAPSPFSGKWKFNASKSSMAGTADSVAAAGTNAWKFTYGSFSWTIKADGTDQPDAFGNTVALKVLSPAKWELTNKTGGRVTTVSAWSLSADGNSMTRISTGKHEDGTPINDSATFKRTAGAKGMEGTWQSTEVKYAPSEVTMDGTDTSVTLTVPADNFNMTFQLDGKDYPATGPRVAAGTTTSPKKVTARKLTAVTKYKDQVLDTETWEISADGRTFTYTELDAGVKNASVMVFDKQ